MRQLKPQAAGPIAIVDLLPGGFEAVMQTPEMTTADAEEGDGEATETNAAPVPVLALPGSMALEHEEVREDRVVLYTQCVCNAVNEYSYKVRANNVGTFTVPPVYGEAMYRPSVYAQGGPAGTITVTAPKQ
jgi:uncharacterized protein YfaS (alpha-2-macroglobulin family)